MKNVLLTIVFLLICLVCFGADERVMAWFAPYPAGFNIDLRSTNYSGISSAPGEDAYWGRNNYNDDVIVALAGARSNYSNNISVKFTISMDFKNDDAPWCYVSASEPYLKRPFGLDFVICYDDNTNNPRSVISIRPDKVYYHEEDFDEVSVNQEAGSLSFTVKPYNNEVWIDICLVLPSGDKVDLSSALSANDYYCGINIAIDVYSENTRIGGDSWYYSFNGYIDEPIEGSRSNVFFNLTPNANANSINLANPLFDVTGSGINIGSYSYETQAFLQRDENDGKWEYDYQIQNDYYIFASSSKDPTNNQSGPFSLVLQGIESDAGLVDTYKLNYLIGLKSNYSDEIIWYDGCSYMTESVEGKYTYTNDWWYGEDYNVDFEETYKESPKNSSASNLLVIGHRILDDMRSDMKSLIFIDQGDILIKATNDFEPENMTAGVYSSTVYFHVISKF